MFDKKKRRIDRDTVTPLPGWEDRAGVTPTPVESGTRVFMVYDALAACEAMPGHSLPDFVTRKLGVPVGYTSWGPTHEDKKIAEGANACTHS